jgi:hypothetical protein
MAPVVNAGEAARKWSDATAGARRFGIVRTLSDRLSSDWPIGK